MPAQGDHDLGVLEILRTDDGKDHTTRHIERVLLDMDIAHDLCAPFTPEQKPFVERVFRTFLHDMAARAAPMRPESISEVPCAAWKFTVSASRPRHVRALAATP